MKQRAISLQVEELDGVIVVTPRETLDQETSGEFQTRLAGLRQAGARYFVIDLSAVTFIDGRGLSALVQLYKRVRLGEGDVRLVGVAPPVRAIFELTRLTRVFEIFPSIPAAAATIRLAE